MSGPTRDGPPRFSGFNRLRPVFPFRHSRLRHATDATIGLLAGHSRSYSFTMAEEVLRLAF